MEWLKNRCLSRARLFYLVKTKKRIPERNALIAMVAPAGFEPATF